MTNTPQTQRPSPVTLTPRAAARMAALLAKKPQAAGIWLSVTTKGCNGKSYKIDYALEAPAKALQIEQHNITLFIAPLAELYILGTEIDYVEEDMYAGFTFKNPNETGRCGCGASFTTS